MNVFNLLMTSGPVSMGWRPHLDNPDWRGWTVVAAYALGAVACVRAARLRRIPAREENGSATCWWLLAAWLTFMAVNKQLDLQSLLLDLARRAASSGGWYGERRHVQLVFCAVLLMIALAALSWLLVRFQCFFKRNLFASAGLAVAVLFVLIRTASVNHALDWAHLQHDDKKWTWALEVGASVCLALAAIKAAKDRGNLMRNKPDFRQ